MPPRTQSKKQTATCKHQASNVDEMANKRLKTNNNESEGEEKTQKGKKKQLVGMTKR